MAMATKKAMVTDTAMVMVMAMVTAMVMAMVMDTAMVMAHTEMVITLRMKRKARKKDFFLS